MGVTLHTGRLTLRQPQMSDAERIASCLGNFEVTGKLAQVPYPYSVADAEAWIGSLAQEAAPENTGLAIELKDDGGVVGVVGFVRRANDRAGLGYYLDEGYWGRGLMTEAATAAVEWFFDATPRSELHSGAFDFNLASLAVQKKLGFVVAGKSKLHSRSQGRELDHIDTVLTRDAFAAARTKAGA
jgi:RimJ/RimL family protein N-acetyltransferase